MMFVKTIAKPAAAVRAAAVGWWITHQRQHQQSHLSRDRCMEEGDKKQDQKARFFLACLKLNY